MGYYRANPAVVHDLVRETEVHRDVHIDQEVFDLEMEHLFANTWIYVDHDSQVPNPGDYYGRRSAGWKSPAACCATCQHLSVPRSSE